MYQTMSKSKFKSRALEFFRMVEQTGTEIVITDHGHPVLKVSRNIDDPEALFKGLRGTVAEYRDPLQPVAEEDWEALS